MNILRLILIVLFFFLFPCLGYSQDRIVHEERQSRFQFAQTQIGISAQFLPGPAISNSALQNSTISPFVQPRFVIGASHFWGLMDFYISIPISGPVSAGDHDLADDAALSTGTTSGIKVYPFYLRQNGISPFVGINWSFLNFSADFNGLSGPEFTNQRLAFDYGFTFVSHSWHLLELKGTYTPNNSAAFFIDREQRADLSWLGWTVSASYRRMFNMTRGAVENPDLSNQDNLNAWHVGIGPSSAQSLSAAEFIRKETPFMNNPVRWLVYPEIAMGYYFHNVDADFRLTFRPMRADHQGFGITQGMRRISLAAEAYKYLFDYHGFVPFAGLSLAQETYRFSQSGEDVTTIKEKNNRLVAGIVVGWDIRPNRYQSFILRTNLRYFPRAGMNIDGEPLKMNTLEINFIQLVVFPQRIFNF